jgi:hypothetical protein
VIDATGLPVDAATATLSPISMLTVGYVRVLELRLQDGRFFHPRLAVSKEDASRAVAIVQPLRRDSTSIGWSRMEELFGSPFSDDSEIASDGRWVIDRALAVVCVQLTALGRLAKASEGPTGVFEIEGMVDECGGPAVQPCTLSPTLFDASEMLANQVDMMKMTITQLRDELRERGAPTSGQLKVILQRRLRAVIIATHCGGEARAAKRRREM